MANWLSIISLLAHLMFGHLEATSVRMALYQQLSSPVRAAGRNGQADDTYPLSELGVILLQEA
jgi:hypothetical protein